MPEHLALLQPRSMAEATQWLEVYGDRAKVVAGGTALSILLRRRLIRPAALISIAGLPGLDAIEQHDGRLRLGALVTHRAVECSPLVRSLVPVLAEAFGVVANVRVRSAATVGGVLAEADYASDPPAVLVALDAEVEATGPSGTRRIPASQFFVGFYETALAPNELVTGVWVPIPPARTRAVYQRFVTRSKEDRPCLGVVAALRLSPTDPPRCQELRVAVGAAAEVPQRFSELEALATDAVVDEDVARAIADGYAERIETLEDLRGSAWYRREMVRVWVRRAILSACDAAADGRAREAP